MWRSFVGLVVPELSVLKKKDLSELVARRHRVTSQKIRVFDIAAVATTFEEVHFRWNRPGACLARDDVSVTDTSLWVQTKAPSLLEATCHRWRTAFYVIAQHVVFIAYGRFGTTYRSHLQGSRIQIKKGRYSLRNNPEERSSLPLRDGSLKSRISPFVLEVLLYDYVQDPQGALTEGLPWFSSVVREIPGPNLVQSWGTAHTTPTLGLVGLTLALD